MEGTTTVTSSTSTTAAPSVSSSSAAPATSAPSESSTPVQRPATFEEAFARDAATQSDSAATPDATAATEPSAATTAESATPGEPPRERWDSILENARKKAADDATQKFQQDYGWAMRADRQALEQAIALSQSYATDRPAFIRNVLAEAITDPTLAPLVRSEAARVLGARQPQAQPAPDLSPDIPVMDANGQIVAQTFSAEKVQQIVQHAIQDALTKEVGPIKQDFQTRQEREQAIRAQQELQTQVQDIYADSRELPGFAEHEAEIAEVFASIPATVAPDKALRQAWKQVVGDKLANRDQVKADQIRELQTKAAASTVNPAAAVVSTAKRPTSFYDQSLKW